MSGNMIEEEQIGARIRQLRIERGLTIIALAEKSGLSKGYLSKVENSRTAPPVSTLMTLAKALDVNINQIFTEDQAATPVTIVRKSERQAISRPGSSFGYSYEPLAPTFPQRCMDPYIVTVPPNVGGTRIFQHKGQEMILMLEGSMEMIIDDKEYRLDEGDCIYFNASLPHFGRVTEPREAKCVVVTCSVD